MILISMVILLFLLVFNTTIDSTSAKYINLSLKILNITRHDLEYPKLWVKKDPFRLSIVERFLKYPLYMPYKVDSIEDTILRVEDSPQLLSNYLSSLLDEQVYAYPVDSMKYEIPEKIPKELRPSLSKLIVTMYEASILARKSFEKLTKGEIDTLLSDAIYWWTDEDDSLDDTLRGVLLREYGKSTPFPYGDTTSVPLDSLSMILEKVKLKYMFSAFGDVLHAVDEFVKSAPKIDSSFFVTFNSPIGQVAIGGSGKNIYRGDYALIIDFGGDDEYYGRLAAGVGILDHNIGVLIDFGGNDVYRSDRIISFGAGYMGIGILYDLGGNDYYMASHVSLGSGLLGCGYLMDKAGSDVYRGGFFTEASGNFGLGILIDKEGNDDYQAYDWAQGFGSVKGAGLLLDKSGNDRYYAGGHYIHHPLLPTSYRSFAQGFAMGWRPDISGGIGLLIDNKGNDSYYVEVYGQGASYWISAGILIDDSGDDTYHGVEYVQGAGIHLSSGILIDREGNDSYYSTHGPSQGEGHDLSVGWLVDLYGNDNYYVSGGQGAGIYNSVGVFVDERGNDTYMTREKNAGEGWTNWGRNAPSVGIFLDLSGKDMYRKGLPGKDNKIWLQGRLGIGIDTEAGR